MVKEKNEAGEDCSRSVGFFSVKVFDIKQTDGKPLQYAKNSEDVLALDYTATRDKLSVALGVHVTECFTGSSRGDYNPITKDIRISDMNNNTDKIRTLFHELAHHILITEDMPAGTLNAGNYDYSAGEVEAELTSNLLCACLGVTFEQSAAYIAGWHKQKPNVRVIKVLNAVQKIANIINK